MYRQLDADLQKIAENELNEKANCVEDDLEHIRQWIRKQPHLNFEIEDQLLLAFLRSRKFSLERTKERIDNYYTIRTLSPEIFTNRDPLLPEIQLILNAGVLLPLPKLHYNSNRIIMFTYGKNLNPDTMSLTNVVKTIYMIIEILVKEDDNCVVSGMMTWTRCKDLPSKYVRQVTLPLAAKYTGIAYNGTPIRIKKMVATECAPLFQYVYNFLKMFGSKKISDRMCLFAQADCEEFYKEIPLELLPEELGGSNGTMKKLTEEWKTKVEGYRDWFLSDEKCKSNEKLRVGAPKTSSDMFGTEGSFRKINID